MLCRRWPRRALPAVAAPCLGWLVLAVAGCQMPHLQPLEPPAGPPQATGEETAEPEPDPGPADTPESPSAAGAVPELTIADVGAGEGERTLRFTVSLSFASGEAVTVRYATGDGTASAGFDYRGAGGTLTFAAGATAAQGVAVEVLQDEEAEGDETFTMRLSEPQGATLAADGDVATGTIVDDDRRAVRVQPAALNVTEGAGSSYTVVLGSQPTAQVTISIAPASAELSVDPRELVFTAGDWAREQPVAVEAQEDDDAAADRRWRWCTRYRAAATGTCRCRRCR